MEREIILGAPMHASNLSDTAKEIVRLALNGSSSMVCVVDVNSLMIARNSADHMRALQAAAIVTSDGMPIVWALRALGHKPAERVSGTDLVHALCGSKEGNQLRHYFLGGAPGIPEKVASTLAGAYGIKVVGTESPSFSKPNPHEEQQALARIHDSRANIVWVGLGCPKQEQWMLENFESLDATLVGVGAAFDFIAGSRKRAPKWMQIAGLEWLHRLAAEPQRLWRRYLITASAFLPLALAEIAVAHFKHSVSVK